MRAATKTALIDACRLFLEAYTARDQDPGRWTDVVNKHVEAMNLHAEDLERRRPAIGTLPVFNGPSQLDRVFTFLTDGQWHSLEEIVDGTGDRTTSVDAQLRHLRKDGWGSWIIDKAPRGRYVHYRLRNPDGTTISPERPFYGLPHRHQ